MGGGGGGILAPAQEFLFGDGGARAAGQAATAQMIEARRQYQDIRGRVDTAGAQFASAGSQLGQATVAGLASLDRDIALQEKNISRQEQLISQLDPTVIEASQQALRLLRGESASTLGPLKAQRDQQRQKVVNMLREQLGPGAETSTAGIQALTRFDAETDQLFAGAQQQALSNLGNVSSQFSAQRPDMLREIAGRSGFGQQQYGLRAAQADFGRQQAQFGLNSAAILQGAGNPLIQSSGAEYTADVLRGQYNRKFSEGLFKMGAGAIMGAAPGGSPGGGSGAGTQAGGSYYDAGKVV